MDLVHDERVATGDEVILEPAACDAGGDDHHVPGRRLRRGFALPVHHPDAERLLEDGLGDRPDAERLADTGARHDTEALSTRGPRAQFRAVLPFEQGVEVEPEGQLDRFARRARGRDHDDPAVRMRGVSEGFGIGWKMMIAGGMHGGE